MVRQFLQEFENRLFAKYGYYHVQMGNVKNCTGMSNQLDGLDKFSKQQIEATFESKLFDSSKARCVS